MSTPIRNALLENSALHEHVRDGMRAVARSHLRDCIHQAVKPRFADSIDIDEAFRKAHPTANRWDYLLGDRASHAVVALEPHSATSSEISVVISKMERAKECLAAHLRAGHSVSQWYWVASGKVDFVPHERAMLRIAAAGITFVGGKLLARHLPEPAPARQRRARRKARSRRDGR